MTGKTAVPYAAPEAAAAEGTARLRRAPFSPVSRSVAPYGSHGAPRAPFCSPRITARKARKPGLFEEFSIAWKNPEKVFHTVENSGCGRSAASSLLVRQPYNMLGYGAGEAPTKMGRADWPFVPFSEILSVNRFALGQKEFSPTVRTYAIKSAVPK